MESSYSGILAWKILTETGTFDCNIEMTVES